MTIVEYKEKIRSSNLAEDIKAKIYEVLDRGPFTRDALLEIQDLIQEDTEKMFAELEEDAYPPEIEAELAEITQDMAADMLEIEKGFAKDMAVVTTTIAALEEQLQEAGVELDSDRMEALKKEIA